MHALTFALVGALAALPSPAPARPTATTQDEVLVRWYDARALLTAELPHQPLIDLRTHLAAALLHSLQPDSYDIELEEPLSLAREGLEDILEELTLALPEIEDIDIDERSGVLRVAANARAQAEIQRLLVDLTTLASDVVEVELHRVSSIAWGAQLGAVLDAARADELFASGQTKLVARRAVPIGRSSALATAGFESFVYDYDVEVAQSAMAADPQVTVVRAGVEFATHVRIAADGRLALRAWGREGRMEQPPRERGIQGFGGATLQLPRVETQLFTSSALISPGGALLVGDAGRASGFVLRARRADAARAPGGAASPFVACGEVTFHPARTRPELPAKASPSGGWETQQGDWPAWLADKDALLESDEVFDSFRDLCEERGLAGRMRRIGPYLYVPDEGPLRDATHAHLTALNKTLSAETFEVELRYGELPTDELSGLLSAAAQEGTYERLLARLDRRVLTSAHSGDSASVTQGVESFYLQDYDIEIAQASTIPDPVVVPLFEGLTFWCVPLRAPTGDVITAVDLAYHAGGAELREFGVADWDVKTIVQREKDPIAAGEFKRRNDVELARTEPVYVSQATRAADGVWALVVGVALDAERSFAALLRVSARR